MWVGIRKANATAQKNSIPPETAREMAELEKFLSDSPSDPAALFSLAMDYATIGDKSRAIKLLEEASLARAGLDPQSRAGRPFQSLYNDHRFRALVAKIEKGKSARSSQRQSVRSEGKRPCALRRRGARSFRRIRMVQLLLARIAHLP